ncbi:hypothetical protein Pst134EA_020948 [Puccinia striiformis f. sp. tritici]|uniref:Uncharacterized protein n=1 Tax=Puccinia striiformis f. sp. tritici PST-78 TaxID=1165861 RepID=A0A0L0VGQ2_9BASI|nr:hypothetical protein Pst134EA_020948 [Puccinia striiformis f. sp. tritici]KAH9457049.1 hypothetical protein Pst134EA_020948 [Puccinia striiformis f. sp. tritici]KNE98401.1 hypothetical protein PSTG_08320 [Puccinia striiformis f. sp. tritici PST-78]
MKKNKEQAEVEAHMVCDEGGSHNFQTRNKPSGCDKCMCVVCFPCYAICSCLLSEGAAFANPFFEQVCCSRTNQERDDEGKATCTKCGLNEREAIDLSDAREVETSQGARNTGYFSNAMSMPAIGVSNQPAQLAPTGSPITPTTNIIPASPITNSN